VLSSSPQSTIRAVPSPEEQPPRGDVELHRVLLAQIRQGSHIALLGEDEVLVQRLEAAGCTLRCYARSGFDSTTSGATRLSDEVREGLETLNPEVIILLDDWVAVSSPGELMRELHAAAPRASLALAFHNAASANTLLSLLTGGGLAPSATEEQVHQWLSASGLSLHCRHLVRETRPEGRLAQDTEQALMRLFQQLNPSSSASRLLYWVCNTIETTAPVHLLGDWVPGLLSVIIRNQSLARMGYLDHAIFSLACQNHAPLEIVIASQSEEPGVEEAIRQVLERHSSLGDYSYQIIREPSSQDIRARLLNLGIRAARGQYIAFLDDDDVVYPQHYERLIALLRKGQAAWAVGRTRRASFRTGPQGELYCYDKATMPRAESFDLAALVIDNFITCHSYVLDRSRLGRFALEFSEKMTVLEDYLFLLHLAALFRPDYLPGPASCEYRIRDDGSNSVSTDNLSEQRRREREQQWAIARYAKDLAKRSIQMLISEQEFEQALRASSTTQTQHPENLHSQPRFQLVDRANSVLKQRLPGTHRVFKSLAQRLLL
jgi:hypothetical protein